MGANGDQFLRELKAETKAMEREFVEFRADVVRDVLRVATGRTPQRSGKTAKSWGANPGRKANYSLWGGSAYAHDLLRGPQIKAGTAITLGNAHFISGFIENGTVHQQARPMLRVGIEHVKDREQK